MSDVFSEDFVPKYLYHSTLPSYIHEVNGSRSENYTTTEFTAHVEYTCPWNLRVSGQFALMQAVYNSPVTYFEWFMPAEAQSAQISVWGAEGVNVALAEDTFQPYTLAKIAVEYKGLARPGNFQIQEQVQPSYKMRQLPSWGYYWRSDGSPVLDSESPAIQEIQTKISRTFSGLHFIPSWFYELGGCVNNAHWMDQITKVVYLPGTLLFVPTNFDRTITWARGDEDYNYTIAFELNWNPIGWNNFRRPSGVDTMMKNGAQVCFYPYKDFSALGSDMFTVGLENSILYSFAVSLIDERNGLPYTIFVDEFGNFTSTRGDLFRDGEYLANMEE